MTTPVLVAVSVSLSQSATTLTVSWPSGYAIRDVGLLCIESANEVIATPSGWTEVTNSPQGTGTAAAAGGVRLAVFYKVAAVSEASVSIADSGDHTSAMMAVFREVDTTTPINVTAGSVLSTANTAITCPSITTTLANAMVVNCVATDRDAVSTTNFSGWTNADLVSITEGFDGASTTNAGGGLGFAYGIKTVAGSVSGTTVTQATSVTAAMITVALNAPQSAPSERATQTPVLALTTGASDIHITQSAFLALYQEGSTTEVDITQTPVLVLYENLPDSRSTQSFVLALIHQVPCLTQEAQCWKITRTDGIALHLTTADIPVICQGVTYSPCDSLSASASSSGLLSGGAGDVTIKGVLSDDVVSAFDVANGVYDNARVEVWIQQWGNQEQGFIPYRIAAGVLGQSKQTPAGYTAELLTPGAYLYQQPILVPYSPVCSWKLGNAQCTVNIESLRVSGSVSHVEDRDVRLMATYRRFTDSGRTEADGYFDLGTIRWVTGANAGLTSEVLSYDSAIKIITLWLPLPHEIVVGDTYTVVPGCDLTANTCRTKFNNYINFGGFEDIPGQDQITKTPNAKG